MLEEYLFIGNTLLVNLNPMKCMFIKFTLFRLNDRKEDH